MRKVAFYIHGFHTKESLHCSELLKGNPGLGGTEYMVLLIAYMLQKRDNGISITVYSTDENKIGGINEIIGVNDFRDAISKSNKAGLDYLVFCHDSQLITDDSINVYSPRTKLIAWCHNFVTWEELDYYYKSENIWKIINVGKEQMELYLDHPIMAKSSFIYNCISIDEKRPLIPNKDRKNIVTYMGCVWPRKGFHWLAEAWPEVKRSIPDAELYVIGSGKLYGWDSNMGPYGIASADYENSFMHFLEVDGKLSKDVHLMGIMGEEKNDILRITKVGVPNPTGNTETFCITAVEMQCQGAKVVMGKCPGALDTVIDGSLISNKKQLARQIINSLKEDTDNHSAAMNIFRKKFSLEAVVGDWEHLVNRGSVKQQNIEHWSYRFKWIKYVVGIIEKHLPANLRLPAVERILLILERKIAHGQTMYQYIPQK